MKEILLFGQIVISTALIIIILLQAKGSGISAVFGGESSFYRSKRGIEKLFVRLTIALAFLFFVFSTLQVVL